MFIVIVVWIVSDFPGLILRKPKIGGSPSRLAWAKVKPYFQNNKSLKGFKHGSSCRVPAFANMES
jgi:hypothetical protein